MALFHARLAESVPMKASSEALAYAESIVETVREPLLILNQNLRVVSANRYSYQTLRVSRSARRN